MGRWRNGRRRGLKIPRGLYPRVGSTPTRPILCKKDAHQPGDQASFLCMEMSLASCHCGSAATLPANSGNVRHFDTMTGRFWFSVSRQMAFGSCHKSAQKLHPRGLKSRYPTVHPSRILRLGHRCSSHSQHGDIVKLIRIGNMGLQTGLNAIQ